MSGENDEHGATEEGGTTSSGSLPLQRFGGRMTTPLAFEGGHVAIPIEIDAPPAGYDPYWEFWHITPNGERRLYADPPAAAEHVRKYHALDEAAGASVDWTRTESGFAVDLSEEDGVDLHLELELETPPTARLANAFLQVVPSSLLHRSFVPRMAAFGARMVLDVDDFAVTGETETGVPFKTDAERLARVTDATLTIDGKPTGEWRRSIGLPDFGDIAVPERPLFVRGGMYLPAGDR